MPISQRGHRPAHWPVRPARPRPAPRTSRMTPFWPLVIAAGTALVFVVFWAQATPLLALVMALATLAAGSVLVTLVTGTAWLTRLARLARLRTFPRP
ncbi:MAG TPA: hypothetical protein VHJ17_12850 [Thermomonospora sp.]|nr:hypothetical protein [Thermomonospora sp.]